MKKLHKEVNHFALKVKIGKKYTKNKDRNSHTRFFPYYMIVHIEKFEVFWQDIYKNLAKFLYLISDSFCYKMKLSSTV